MLAATLSVLKIQSLGYSSADGVELYLLGKAGDREILELESISEQVGLLQSLDGELFLRETLLSLDEAASYFDRLFDAWRCGRDEELEMIIIEQYGDNLEGHEEMMEDVIFERNVMMANRVEALLKRPGTYFLVVGAGHMVGDRGIPAELRKRHYDVVRL